MNYPINISMCGFGGQGIVLLSVLLGTAAVTEKNLYAVQTQSYGSEARGGQCQAELILNKAPINSPVAEKKDILVCMFQDAYDRYISTVKEDGTLILDHHLVTKQTRKIKNTFEVPATEIAVGLGNRMAANMVMLGFICEAAQLMGREDLFNVIRNEVAPKFVELNLKAVDAGIEFAKANHMYIRDGQEN